MEGFGELAGQVRFAGLHVIRMWAAVTMLPILGAESTPRLHRLGLALFLGLVAASARADAFADPGTEPLGLAVLVVQEAMMGILLGWMASIAFDAARIAGTLVATEMGLNLANQVDPARPGQVGLFSQLYQSVAIVLFFLAGGHRFVTAAFVGSFDAAPPGAFIEAAALGRAVVAFSVAAVEGGVRLAAPVLVVMVVVTGAVGLLAKVAPSLHVLEASYSIRILAGLLLLILFLPHMTAAFDLLFDDLGRRLGEVAFGGAGG